MDGMELLGPNSRRPAGFAVHWRVSLALRISQLEGCSL